MSDRPIGTCRHGKALHYRYPCVECEADTLTEHITDELLAGFTTANGLLQRIHNLAVDQFKTVLARVEQK